MIAIWISAALVLAASAALGRAAARALGGRSGAEPALGFALLVTLAPLLVRLPGRGATAAALLALAALAGAVWSRRRSRPAPGGAEGADEPRWVALALAVLVVLVASLPFLFNERTGVLGEGIYTNDHAAQLYWADWLAHGFGPEPSAVAFGYPIGPQALAAALSAGLGFDLVATFNGLLLAIPALTAICALALLGGLPRGRRLAAAALTGLPYLAASFLAQSAFKETAMALYLVGLAAVLASAAPARARLGAGLVLALGAAFTYSLPGLAWFAGVALLWGVLRLLSDGGARRATFDVRRRFAPAVAVAAAVVGAAVVVVALVEPVREFLLRVDDIRGSRGRLASPIFPGEALGIWPEGDFRIVRGEVPGALVASAFAGACLLWALVLTLRRREWALPATLGTAALIYLLSRPLAEIHVEAKALAIMAPLAVLATLRALLAPAAGSAASRLRLAVGVAFALLAAGSTLLALRAAPVGFDERQRALERLAERIEGERVVFLGVDRFGAYYLRGTLIESPAGFVPPEVRARPAKAWRLGEGVDFDTVAPHRLDRFDYAITTAAAYASTPPPNWREVARDGDYVLWERTGPTPRSRVLPGERGDPGQTLECDGRHARFAELEATALVLPEPVRAAWDAWRPRRAFAAPGEASQRVRLGAGAWRISLQYHSQVPLTLEVDGERRAELPPSLEGIYLLHEGRGAWWPAGEVELDRAREVEVRVRAAEPSALQRALGVERRVWLGNLAFSEASAAAEMPLRGACGRYVDRFLSER